MLRKACGVVIGVAERMYKLSALKRWMTHEIRCNRNEVTRGSLVTERFDDSDRITIINIFFISILGVIDPEW